MSHLSHQLLSTAHPAVHQQLDMLIAAMSVQEAAFYSPFRATFHQLSEGDRNKWVKEMANAEMKAMGHSLWFFERPLLPHVFLKYIHFFAHYTQLYAFKDDVSVSDIQKGILPLAAAFLDGQLAREGRADVCTFLENGVAVAKGKLEQRKSSPPPVPSASTQQEGNDILTVKQKAESGDANAQYLLGEFYFKGEGVSGDPSQGVKWTLKAANQGHIEAQMRLGVSYLNGHGIEHDAAKGVKWTLAAAERGHTNAQFNLGSVYEEGKDVPKDLKEAYKWFSLAAVKGHSMAKHACADVAKLLPASDLTEAKSKASQFRPKS